MSSPLQLFTLIVCAQRKSLCFKNYGKAKAFWEKGFWAGKKEIDGEIANVKGSFPVIFKEKKKSRFLKKSAFLIIYIYVQPLQFCSQSTKNPKWGK